MQKRRSLLKSHRFGIRCQQRPVPDASGGGKPPSSTHPGAHHCTGRCVSSLPKPKSSISRLLGEQKDLATASSRGKAGKKTHLPSPCCCLSRFFSLPCFSCSQFPPGPAMKQASVLAPHGISARRVALQGETVLSPQSSREKGDERNKTKPPGEPAAAGLCHSDPCLPLAAAVLGAKRGCKHVAVALQTHSTCECIALADLGKGGMQIIWGLEREMWKSSTHGLNVGTPCREAVSHLDHERENSPLQTCHNETFHLVICKREEKLI